VTVLGQVIATDQGWSLELDVKTAAVHDHRSLAANDCGALADAAALVVATSVDPARVAETLQPRPDEPDDPFEDRAAEPDGATARTPSPLRHEPDRRIRGAIRTTAGAGYGLLPGVAGGVQGDGVLMVGRARVVLGAAHWFAKSTSTGGAEGRIRLTAGRLRGCYAPSVKRLEIPLCGGVQLGSLHARIETATQIDTSRALWVALDVGPGLTWAPIDAFALHAQVDAVVAVRRIDFEEDDATVFRSPPAGVQVLLGIEARFP
jgi:hypothetical protein